MSWESDMLSKIMIWQDFFERFWVRVVGIHVDVKISSDNGGVGEGAYQRNKIMKILKEIFGELVRVAVKTDQGKLSLNEVYRGNNMLKTIVPGREDEYGLESFIH